MLNTLKRKILASIISITSLCTLCFMSISYYEVRSAVMNQMKDDGSTLIAVVSREIAQYRVNQTDEILRVFVDVVNKSKGNIAYISIVDTKMNMLISSDDISKEKDSTRKGNNVDSVSSATSQGDVSEAIKDEKTTGFIFKTPEGRSVYNVSTPFYESSKLIGTINIGISLNNMHRFITQGLIETLIISLIMLLIAVVISVVVSNKLTRPLNKIMEKLDDFSKGDFTIQFEGKGKDEIGKLRESLNNSVTVLGSTISGVKNIVNNLNDISSRVNYSGEVAAASSKNVSEAVGEVFNGVNQQADSICEVAGIIEVFGEAIDKAQSGIRDTVESSGRIKSNADKGSIELGNLIKSIDDVRNSFSINSGAIQNLNNNVIKISEITELINSVAEQTNLLALNAAIEAARAGEAGRGFSVVADEIRKLAEQVLVSSKNINSLIEAVRSGTHEVSENTTLITNKMNKQMSVVGNTEKSFNDILLEVNNTIMQMNNVNSLLENIVAEKTNILGRIEVISGTSEEVAASAREIAASSEEQSMNVDKLAELAQELKETSEELNGRIKRFKV